MVKASSGILRVSGPGPVIGLDFGECLARLPNLDEAGLAVATALLTYVELGAMQAFGEQQGTE